MESERTVGGLRVGKWQGFGFGGTVRVLCDEIVGHLLNYGLGFTMFINSELLGWKPSFCLPFN